MKAFTNQINGGSGEQGTFDAQEANSLMQEGKNLVETSGQTTDASGADLVDPNTFQMAQAVSRYVGASNFFVDSGTANTYVLTRTSTFRAITGSYIEGEVVRFNALNGNTAGSTINADGRGVRPLTLEGGAALPAGWISTTSETQAKYRSSGTPRFEVIRSEGIFLSQTGFTTGDVKPTYKTTADPGWIMADDGSIGNASSGATNRANADTLALYTLLWNNILDAYAPVSGGRGVSAAADFSANKRLTIPRTLGRALSIGGAGAGLTSRALGQYLGTENEALATSQIPGHQHFVANTAAVSGFGANPLAAGNTLAVDYSSGGTIDDYVLQGSGAAATVGLSSLTGSGSAHNNMQPSTFLNIMIKL